MKKFVVTAALSALLLLPAAAHAQNGGYTGVIAPSGQPDARAAQAQEAARAQLDAEKARVDAINAEQLNRAMEDAKRKQQELTDRAAQAEHEANSGVDAGKEWTAQQHKDYQKSLMDVTRQQQQLEEMAKRELEAATKAHKELSR